MYCEALQFIEWDGFLPETLPKVNLTVQNGHMTKGKFKCTGNVNSGLSSSYMDVFQGLLNPDVNSPAQMQFECSMPVHPAVPFLELSLKIDVRYLLLLS